MSVRETFMGVKRTEFMLGPELEKTVMFGHKTLLVQGIQSTDKIVRLCKEYDVMHVYLGANLSYTQSPVWNDIITELLTHNLVVTLDYSIADHMYVISTLDEVIYQHPKFIPMININLPNLESLNPNLTVKFDDRTLSSKGVWCLGKNDITDSKGFTSFELYTTDVSIE